MNFLVWLNARYDPLNKRDHLTQSCSCAASIAPAFSSNLDRCEPLSKIVEELIQRSSVGRSDGEADVVAVVSGDDLYRCTTEDT